MLQTRRLRLTYVLGLSALLILARGASAQEVQRHLNAILDGADFNGSILITKGESTLLSRGMGLANREQRIPNTPRTKYRVGSITKQFTAAAVLILQDRGVLRVSETVDHFLPDAPDAWRAITLHQLLTHTSGIMHSWALPGFRETMAVPTSLDETLARFHDEPLLFTPGSSFTYSGTGYFLLAKIIEVASGKPYGQFLHDEIFSPLQMSDTGADRPELILAGRASGYERDQSGLIRNAPDVFMPLLTGGGNLYSTVRDLAKWHRALTEHALISERGYAQMYEPERNDYAYGWGVREVEGRLTLGHGGSVPGFNAFILRIPGEDICVVLLANQATAQLGVMARALASAVLTS